MKKEGYMIANLTEVHISITSPPVDLLAKHDGSAINTTNISKTF